MTEPVSDDDLPAEDVYDPTGLELASEIAHQTARTSPLLPEVPALPPKIPKRRRWAGEQRSGAHPDDRDPQPIGSVLDAVAKRRGWHRQISLATVLRDWSGLVGAVNAQHSDPDHPVRLHRLVLGDEIQRRAAGRQTQSGPR